MSKHAPGPWTYERDIDYYTIRAADGTVVVDGKDNHEGNDSDYDLIAAAPRLYDACNGLLGLLALLSLRDDAPNWLVDACKNNHRAIEARSAIAQVDGDTA